MLANSIHLEIHYSCMASFTVNNSNFSSSQVLLHKNAIKTKLKLYPFQGAQMECSLCKASIGIIYIFTEDSYTRNKNLSQL